MWTLELTRWQPEFDLYSDESLLNIVRLSLFFIHNTLVQASPKKTNKERQKIDYAIPLSLSTLSMKPRGEMDLV